MKYLAEPSSHLSYFVYTLVCEVDAICKIVSASQEVPGSRLVEG